jgi:hypothetical protein
MGRDRENWRARKNIYLLLLHTLLNSTTCVGSGVVLLQNNAGAMTLLKRDNNRCKDFISISGCVEVAINNDQRGSVSGSDASVSFQNLCISH